MKKYWCKKCNMMRTELNISLFDVFEGSVCDACYDGKEGDNENKTVK